MAKQMTEEQRAAQMDAKTNRTQPKIIAVGRQAVHAALHHGVQLYTKDMAGWWKPCSNAVAIRSQQMFGEDWASWMYGVIELPNNTQRCAGCDHCRNCGGNPAGVDGGSCSHCGAH